jgi:hypothetical protein
VSDADVRARGGCGRAFAVSLWLALAGCFGEGLGTKGSCDEGTHGCECYGNGTCNGGLMCVVEANVCVAEDCIPGKPLCTCVDGECLGGAMCENGVCFAPAGSSESGAAGGATTEGTSLATSDTAATSSADLESSAGDTGGDPCGTCFDAAVDMRGGDCVMPADACMADPACVDHLACVSQCAHQEPTERCLMGCCADAPPVASALASCLGFACGDNGDGIDDSCPIYSCG